MRSRSTSRWLVVVLAIMSDSCTGGPGPPGPEPCWEDPAVGTAEGEVELGVPGTPFQAILDEQPLELVRGPQGGHHFSVRARTRGMSPEAKSLFTAYLGGDRRADIFECPFRTPYQDASSDGFNEISRDYVNVIVSQELVPEIVGARVLMRVEVVDVEGRYATNERWIVAYKVADSDAGTSDGG